MKELKAVILFYKLHPLIAWLCKGSQKIEIFTKPNNLIEQLFSCTKWQLSNWIRNTAQLH